MGQVFAFLEAQPFILLFLVVGAGFALARIHVAGISLGVVACTLIFGLLLSLWAVHSAGVSFDLPPLLQVSFFNLYIFCVGLRVGPQCFAALERSGKQFLALACVTLVLTPLLAAVCGWLFQMDAGTLAGVIAGSNTASASFGAAQSAAQAGAAGPDSARLAVNLSVSFAIAYALSLVAFVVALPFLPRLTHTDARSAVRDADQESGSHAPLPQTDGALRPGYMPVDIRAYRIARAAAAGKSVSALAQQYPRLSIEAVRRAGRMIPVQGNLVLQLGDEVAIGGRVDTQLRLNDAVGPEIDAAELRDVHPDTADVVISRKDLVGRSLDDLRRGPGHGLFFNAAFRMGEEIPLDASTRFKHGDVLRVTGSRSHIDTLTAAAGTVVRASSATDLLTVAAGMVAGALFGAISVHFGGLQLGIGPTAGLLVAAIVLSWLRTRRPQFGGPVPEPARQLLEDLGLSIFIATVGLSAGPGLTTALGAGTVTPILVTTMVLGFVPAVAAWFVGIRILGLNAAVLLGAITGVRQSSPALKIAQDAVGSPLPAVGFPVPFTVATVAFTLYGYLVMALWPIR